MWLYLQRHVSNKKGTLKMDLSSFWNNRIIFNGLCSVFQFRNSYFIVTVTEIFNSGCKYHDQCKYTQEVQWKSNHKYDVIKYTALI